jgi:hypothetical protein
MLHSVDAGNCGSREPTRSWLGESKRLILPLADEANAEFHGADVGRQGDDATKDDVRSTLGSMQQWIIANPCPDLTVRAQLEVVAGRYGFLALALETSNEALGKSEVLALSDHLDATDLKLRAVMVHVERGLQREDPDDARD